MKFIDSLLWFGIENDLGYYVEVLLEGGANVESENQYKQTPIIYTCEIRNYNIAEYLVLYANLNKRDIWGRTALMYICKNGDYDMAYYLMDRGANVNIKDKCGKTALIYVCEDVNQYNMKERKYLVERLINEGADVNTKDKCGKTALMYVCENVDQYNMEEREYLAEMLIKEGADVNIKDKEKKSLLEYAYCANMFCLVIYILSYQDYFRKYSNKGNDFDNCIEERIKFYSKKSEEDLSDIIAERINNRVGTKRKLSNIEMEQSVKRIREREG